MNSNELAIIMVKAIIAEGWNTGGRIIGTLQQLGFHPDHARTTLGKNRRDNRNRHHWRRTVEGPYVVLDQEAPKL